MTTAEIRPATEQDAIFVGARLREGDRAEVRAIGRDPDTAVERAFKLSMETDVGLFDGVAGCLFGLGVPALFGHVARPWLLGTDVVERHPMVFLLHSRLVVSGWAQRYRLLENYVHAENRVSLRWLKWLGFTIDGAAAFGPDGAMFHRFYIER